jgi:hypothetical protein
VRSRRSRRGLQRRCPTPASEQSRLRRRRGRESCQDPIQTGEKGQRGAQESAASCPPENHFTATVCRALSAPIPVLCRFYCPHSGGVSDGAASDQAAAGGCRHPSPKRVRATACSDQPGRLLSLSPCTSCSSGCNRSFAELWRLKVHFRAPPDVRGSGKERGHGTELKFCPKCGKDLRPGKHHVGCSAGKSAPRQAAKRQRQVRALAARTRPPLSHVLLFPCRRYCSTPPVPQHRIWSACCSSALQLWRRIVGVL